MQHSMEVTLNSNYFQAQKDLPVAVFEYWTVQGRLIRECVPLADMYNMERVSEIRKLVGYGLMLKADKPGRWERIDWIVDWDRKQATPDYPYAGWKRRLVWGKIKLAFRLIRTGRAFLLPEIYDRRFFRWLWQELRS